MTGPSLLPYATEPGRARVASLEIWHLGAVYLVRVLPDPLNPESTRDGQKIAWGEVPSVVRVTAMHAAGLYDRGTGAVRLPPLPSEIQKQKAQQHG